MILWFNIVYFLVIELACGEYGNDKIETLVQGTQNGRSHKWFDNPAALLDAKALRGLYFIIRLTNRACNYDRGYIKLRLYV